MNYRHAFHAGNAVDVVKHAVLICLIRALLRKDKPFTVLDTHAGAGTTDLIGPEAQRSGEYRAGIARVLALPDPPAALAPYLEVVRATNGGATLTRYPGSPVLALALMRPQDRLIACELHPEDAAALKAELARDPRAAVHHRDGYEALGALTPPPIRRGLVLIDPPYETVDEFERMVAGLRAGHARWPQATYALWYPIKARGPVDRFLGEVASLGIPATLAVEAMLAPADPAAPNRLLGCGLAIVNAPFGVEGEVRDVLGPLGAALNAAGTAQQDLRWLVARQ